MREKGPAGRKLAKDLRLKLSNNGAHAMSWLSLSQATTILDHDVQRGHESLGRAISKAWIVGPASPTPAIDSNVPLRIQVTPSPGWRLAGRGWLETPVLLGDLRN